jgi:uncharacterized protein YqfA (UPF0365 family)
MNPAPNTDATALFAVALAFVSLFVLLFVAAFFFVLAGPWFRAFLSGAPIMLTQLIGMRLRGVPPRLIVDALVTLVHRGHPHSPKLARDLESTYLAQRGLIQSSTHLADIVEKQLPKAAASA